MLIPAACPACRARVTRSEYFRTGSRPCDTCGTIIVPIALWNWAGNIVFGIALALMLLIALAAGVFWVWPVFVLGVAGAVMIVVLGYVVFPYITPFEILPQAGPIVICRRCGYDLRATPHRCPECGIPVPPPH